MSNLTAARMMGIKGLSKNSTEAEINAAIVAKAQTTDQTEDRPEEITAQDSRTPRSSEDREKSTRQSDSWKPASILPAPDPRDGWAFRYVRTSMVGQSDLANVSKKFREGWVPIQRNEFPELEKDLCDLDGRFTKEGNFESGGQLLCKMPQETLDKRNEYYDNVNAQQMASVDQNHMKDTDPRMPVTNPERSSRTSFRGS